MTRVYNVITPDAMVSHNYLMDLGKLSTQKYCIDIKNYVYLR